MAPRSIAYIDAFNVYYGLLRLEEFRGHKWVDLEKYGKLLRPDDDRVKIYYFASDVIGSAAEGQKKYQDALGTLKTVVKIDGSYTWEDKVIRLADTVDKPRFVYNQIKEKRTDVNIAVRIMDDVFNNRCDYVLLVSGDSDLLGVVDWVAKYFDNENKKPENIDNIKKKMIVYVPAPRKNHPRWRNAKSLRYAAHESHLLPGEFFSAAQFPPQIPDGKGGLIIKPKSWCLHTGFPGHAPKLIIQP